MPDERNIQHDKKVIHEKEKKGENLAEGAAHVPQPGKKTAAEHKAHGGIDKETEEEKSGRK